MAGSSPKKGLFSGSRTGRRWASPGAAWEEGKRGRKGGFETQCRLPGLRAAVRQEKPGHKAGSGRAEAGAWGRMSLRLQSPQVALAAKKLPMQDPKDPGLRKVPWRRARAWRIPWTEEPAGHSPWGSQSQTQPSTRVTATPKPGQGAHVPVGARPGAPAGSHWALIGCFHSGGPPVCSPCAVPRGSEQGRFRAPIKFHHPV